MESVDTSQTRQPLVIGVTTVLTVLTVLAVVLRFIARTNSGLGLSWDDWCIFAAFPWSIVINALAFYDVSIGYGLHEAALKDPAADLANFFKAFYASEATYNTCLAFTKASILLFYLRIFPTRYIRLGVYVCGTCVVLWYIGKRQLWQTP